jgi:hypothetical protein
VEPAGSYAGNCLFAEMTFDATASNSHNSHDRKLVGGGVEDNEKILEKKGEKEKAALICNSTLA